VTIKAVQRCAASKTESFLQHQRIEVNSSRRSRILESQKVTTPRMGVMPSFGKRPGDVTLKLVAVFIHTLGGGEP